jgi:hypothetical protein
VVAHHVGIPCDRDLLARSDAISAAIARNDVIAALLRVTNRRNERAYIYIALN